MSVDLLTTSYYTAERLPEIRGTILDVFSDVYADDIATDPFFSMERFEERLTGHTSVPGWACVVAEVETEIAGFIYGRPEKDRTTFGLCENMLRPQWRGRGIARVMHDELMSHRTEERVSLLVRRSRPELRGMYEAWGYQQTAERQPFPDSPLYDVMVLELHTAAITS